MVTPALSETTTTVRSEYDRPERKRGARLMIVESGVGAVASGVYGNFISAFIIRLGATTSQMGLLSACTQLLCAISQLSAAHAVRLFGGRKRMVIGTVLISALPWIFITIVPLLPVSLRAWALIPLASIAWALFIICDPVWGSWMSDMVPFTRRGRYLGLRGSMATMVSLCIGIGGAAVLDRLHGYVMWGFVTLFIIALIARLASAWIFSRVVDPRPDLRLQPGIAPWKQFASMRQSVIGRFNLFVLMFHIGIFTSAPFYSIFMLRDLGISYTMFVGLGFASSVASVLVMPVWGKLVDKRGNMFVLAIASPAHLIYPVQFLISTNYWWLFTTHIIIGITTSGWGIAAYNFVIQHSDEETRPSSVGYYQAMAALGAFSGALLGGAIAGILPRIMTYQLFSIFIFSAVIRISSVIFFLPRINAGSPSAITGGGPGMKTSPLRTRWSQKPMEILGESVARILRRRSH